MPDLHSKLKDNHDYRERPALKRKRRKKESKARG